MIYGTYGRTYTELYHNFHFNKKKNRHLLSTYYVQGIHHGSVGMNKIILDLDIC